jgi:DNA-3-methyladenine glycosylase II
MSGNPPEKGKVGQSGKRTSAARAPAKAKTKAKAALKAKKSPRAAPGKAAPAGSHPSKAKKRKIIRRPKAAIVYHPGPLIDSEQALAEAAVRLRALDPEMIDRLVEIGGATPLRRQDPGFAGLVRIIVAQQVSTASANAIFKRVEAILAPLTAEIVLAASDEKLRACGLSLPKMRAMRALAQAVAQDGLDLVTLGALVAEEAHRALVAVKGIGPWTADVFLLFCLGHPDAFPGGDIALQEAAKLALGLKQRPDAQRLEEIAERWRPLRGVAARMLWAYYRAARQRVGMALEGG